MIRFIKRLFAKPQPVALPPKQGGITSMALERAKRKEAQITEFVRYEPPAGVIPEGKRESALAMDSTPYDYVNQAYVSNYFPGYQYLAMLAQLPEYRKMAEVPAKEMTRKWIKLRSKGDDDKSDKIAQLETALEKYKVRAAFRRAAELDAFYGRAQIYIDVDKPSGGAAYDDDSELSTLLLIDKAKIKKGSLKSLRIVEPIWTYPSAYNSTNPLAPNYYRPQSWFVMGKTVHVSRLLSFVSREVPDLLKSAYNFGGLSMSQMAQPYVNNWLRTRDSVSDVVHSFSTSGVKTNMSSVLGGTDDAQFFSRAELFNTLRDNKGLMLMDKDTEDFFQFNVPLGGLDKLQAQSQEQMSAVSSIPLVKLLGITPSGLNASAEGEIQVFYDHLHSMQEALFTDPLNKVLQVIQLSEFGEIDDDITYDFETLYGMDDTEKATVRKTDADTDAVLVGIGAISPDEARARVAADPDSGYDSIEGEAPGIEEDDDPAQDAAFNESDHPRADNGEFTSGGGSSKSAHLKSVEKEHYPEHIKALKLPPAWTDVKVSHDKDADLLAVGKDSKGRPQYVYSQKFKDSQSAKKFERTRLLIKEYPGIEKQVKQDAMSGNEAKKSCADCMSLIMKMGVRPGSENDTGAEKKAYGATTLEGRHVIMDGENVALSFVGKKGVQLDLPVHDEGLKSMLKDRAKAAGNDGQLFGSIDDKRLLDYSHSLDGGHFKSKDFRTHVGTATAHKEVEGLPQAKNEKEYKKLVQSVATKVSQVLGNTPKIALESYIDPSVFNRIKPNGTT